jgi:GDP/UDP-N,N'-diacetylbacillosamine 2-epimerase (hydrolysing)
VRVVNVGDRQAGRERCGNVVDSPVRADAIRAALENARGLDVVRITHPYGDGHAGTRIAKVLAGGEAPVRNAWRKRCTY